MKRLKLRYKRNPNFIGFWQIENDSICDDLIELFEQNKNKQVPGSTGRGGVNETIKKTIDFEICPADLSDIEFRAAKNFIGELEVCYKDYLEQWEPLKAVLPSVHIGPFNIQKYEVGGHFSHLHAERNSIDTLHRMHAWMMYLNDVEVGGETVFPMFELKIKPTKGQMLIWPADWTHSHFGSPLEQGEKYIITGWMNFPIDSLD